MHWSAKYVGIPYVENGRSSLKGLDCWGLIRTIYLNERNIELPLYGEVSATELLRVTRMIQASIQVDAQTGQDLPWKKIAEEHPLQEFDICYMTGSYRGADHKMHSAEIHVGIIAEIRLGIPYILHTQPTFDSVILPATHVSLRHRIKGFCRHGQYQRLDA